ncbi:MAG TPA: Gfo/Idh/MocA family oxidoreductase [Syntrophorhabdus sp.]|nr:Gfo/Idh/MocA family oxidoreductase [Syntrophorhabdus sp.]HNQ45490.1 Gfo/Idh/MocA family oxidoreductase [Syntrophorhabdus sp.]HPB38404.1 Gfo/Idh/MocA family oxidoreductase [Syntrophorhabdus sp.]HQP54611.1 Gfo/Idh/MocA family oxidoreductase [Syntrophorhabdus sp.]
MPIKMALVGCGHMGKIHLQKLSSFDEIQIVGIVDVDTKRANDLAQPINVPAFNNYKKLLGNVDGVIIATPTETHYQIAKDFLKSRTHILLEKPITSRQDQAQELIDLAQARQLILQVGFLERFNPAFSKILPIIKKPLLIESRRSSEFTGRSTDIDVVLDLMIHDIDLILSIVREDVCDIRAQGVSFITDKLDMASARIEFSNGCIADLNASRISSKKERTLTVFEGNQIFFIDLLNRRVVYSAKEQNKDIDTEEYTVDPIDAVKYEISLFIQSILTGTAPIVRGEDGLRALTLADQVKQRIAENRL